MHDDGDVNNLFCPDCCANLARASIIIKSNTYGDQVCASSISINDCSRWNSWKTFQCPGNGLTGESIEIRM